MISYLRLHSITGPLTLVLIIIMLIGCQTTRLSDRYQALSGSFGGEGRLAQKVRVGLLLPLSGDHANLGTAMKNAAELSLFETSNGLLELLIFDTNGTADGAIKTFQKAYAQGIQFIIGPLLAHSARAIAPQARAHNVNIITFSTDLSLRGQGTYVFGFNTAEQIRRMVNYAKDRGLRNIAAILPKSAYGQVVEKELQELSAHGIIQLQKTVFYNPDAVEFTDVAQKLKGVVIDGLVIPEGGGRLKIILSSLLYQELPLKDFKLLGSGQWDTPDIVQNHQTHGQWFVAPPIEKRKIFEKRYNQYYGHPPYRLTTLAYDAVALVATLVQTNQPHPFNFERLTQSRGFVGVDGLFRLCAGGDTQRSLAVYEVTPGGPKVLSLAPTQFKKFTRK
jgi:branched-chain amino acid transport system substrate-binding protein